MARKSKKQKTATENLPEVNNFADFKKQIFGEVMLEIGGKMDEVLANVLETVNKNV